ncbi:MAG: helix-turn-helix domain-containing protein [Gallintestinimicrobium sp.]
MDCHHCITESAERKKGQHLRMEDRGAIKVLKKQVLDPRAIARQIGCAPSTVTNELRRGHTSPQEQQGKAPGYSPRWEKPSIE